MIYYYSILLFFLTQLVLFDLLFGPVVTVAKQTLIGSLINDHRFALILFWDPISHQRSNTK